MMHEPAKPRQMPLWGLVVVALLFCVAAFSFGVEVGRDMAVARPEQAAGIDRYTRPGLIGSLVGAVGLCIWVSSRGGRAAPGTSSEGDAAVKE